MSNHVEFPNLTSEAMASFDAAIKVLGRTNATASRNALCRAFAAFLREAMKQAYDHCGHDAMIEGLEAIANSLHNPPPPPPTLAKAREAARQLAGENAAIVHAFLATLGEGEEP